MATELIEPAIDEVETHESTSETELEPGPAADDGADDYESPAEESQAEDTDDELKLKRIGAAEKRVRYWGRKLELAKLRAKAAKAEWENACGELQRVIRDEIDPEPNLFNSTDDDDEEEDSEEDSDEEVEEEPAPSGALAGEEWRSVKLAAISLAPAIVEKLAAAGIDTVGTLSDYLTPNDSGFCKRLTDIAGVGEKKAEQIEAALDQFWSTRGKESA